MSTPSLDPPAPKTQKDWVQRNWKWLFPAGFIGLIIVSAAFVGGIFLLVESSFRNSDVYAQALARARANPKVIECIGQPLKAAWVVTGDIQLTNASGHATLSIPISGPAGKGTIYAVARKKADVWKFDTLRVDIQGQAQRIDLLQPPPRVPAAKDSP